MEERKGRKFSLSRKDANIFSNRCCLQKDASWFKFYAKGDFLNNSFQNQAISLRRLLPNKKKSTERLCSLQDRTWIGIASASGGEGGGGGGGQISIAVMRPRFVFHVYMYPAWGGKNSYLRRPNVARIKIRYLGSSSRTERKKDPPNCWGEKRTGGYAEGVASYPRPPSKTKMFFGGVSKVQDHLLQGGREMGDYAYSPKILI